MNAVVQQIAFAPPASANHEDRLRSVQKRTRFLFAAIVLGLGLPLAFIPISGAVIAQGEVTVTTHDKKIAHPKGGVIAELPVSNGSRVHAGDLLMRLDTSVSAGSAAMFGEGVDQLAAREARLRAERDTRSSIEFAPDLLARRGEPAAAAAMAQQQRVFELDRATLSGQRAALRAQIAQAEKASGSYFAQANVFRRQAALVAEERSADDELWKKGFTTLRRRNELARAAVGVEGDVASAEAQASQLSSKIAELHQQMLVLDSDFRQRASAELEQVQQRLIDMRQNDLVARDTDTRNSIRAPYAGVVEKLAYTTVGGVVPAGETLMEIVPDHDPLMVTARIAIQDVDHVVAGQPVKLRFSALDSRTTPEIGGKVVTVASDRTVDQQHGVAYYPVEIEIPEAELLKLEGRRLRPGMPVEAFIQTGARTLLNYLVKPLTDQMARAFR